MAASAALVAITAIAAHAGMVTFALKDATRDTGWIIEFDDTQIKNPKFTGIEKGAKKGTLSFDKEFAKDVKSITIKFMELGREQSEPSSFGLRIAVNEHVINKSGSDWTGFKQELVHEKGVRDIPNGTELGDDEVSDAHPGFAHFHDLDGGVDFSPFKVIDPKNGDMDATKSFGLGGGGKFKDGEDKNWNNIGIHQWEEQDKNRDFRWIETAIVPEPAALVLMSIGMVASIWYARRRHRQAAA